MESSFLVGYVQPKLLDTLYTNKGYLGLVQGVSTPWYSLQASPASYSGRRDRVKTPGGKTTDMGSKGIGESAVTPPKLWKGQRKSAQPIVSVTAEKCAIISGGRHTTASTVVTGQETTARVSAQEGPSIITGQETTARVTVQEGPSIVTGQETTAGGHILGSRAAAGGPDWGSGAAGGRLLASGAAAGGHAWTVWLLAVASWATGLLLAVLSGAVGLLAVATWATGLLLAVLSGAVGLLAVASWAAGLMAVFSAVLIFLDLPVFLCPFPTLEGVAADSAIPTVPLRAALVAGVFPLSRRALANF
ncbi:hypothetical protein NDU88_002853 [Pleurodeles waltl]|uniref:Uncharacterized protein n=1 Tax=Pleurodeles waltl TaxID=8319 RepID=A0AAV7WTK8_PLEWA|nr:hypothetical protein NDU88_002853 [Pleurodeles waltl]